METNFLIKVKKYVNISFDLMFTTPWLATTPLSTTGPCLSLSLSVSGSRHKQNLFLLLFHLHLLLLLFHLLLLLLFLHLLLLLKVAASPSDRPNIVWASKSRQSSGTQNILSALKTRPRDLTRREYCGKSCLKFPRKRFNHGSGIKTFFTLTLLQFILLPWFWINVM